MCQLVNYYNKSNSSCVLLMSVCELIPVVGKNRLLDKSCVSLKKDCINTENVEVQNS